MKISRKISAHVIFPVSAEPIANGIINVDGDGTILSIERSSSGSESYDTEFYNGAIVPGLVNAHCHLELSCLRNIFRENCGIAGFYGQMLEKRNENIDRAGESASIYDSKMYREGVSVCADILNSAVTADVKKKSKIHYINFVEVFGLDPNEAAKILKKADETKQAFCNSHITPHTLFTLSDDLFDGLAACLKNEDLSSLHYLESDEEVRLLNDGTGNLSEKMKEMYDLRPSVENYGRYGMLKRLYMPSQRLLLIHNTFADRNDVDEMNALFPGSFRVLCPVSNRFITGKMPDVTVFDTGKICIGTDSLASNGDLNMLSEIRMLLCEFPELSFGEILRWATLNGAMALKVERTFGSIEPGKKPGLVLLDNFNFISMKPGPETIARRLV